MATEILVRVYLDGSGDYTNLRAAVIAEAIDLVAADSYMVFELKGDLRNTDAFVDFAAYTTDATRNIIIRPIAADYTDGIAGNTGTIYGVNTFAIVCRLEFITIDGLDFDGWVSQFFTSSNLTITNSLLYNGSSNVDQLSRVVNTIFYNVPNQSLSRVSSETKNVTIINKTAQDPSSTTMFNNITSPLTFCVALNENGSSTEYVSSTNASNDFNASNDGTAPGTNTQTVATTDFEDYANNNFNIKSTSPLFALNVGADLVPASGGISGAITQTAQSFTQSLSGSVVNSYTGTITQNTQSFTQSASGSITSEPITGVINQTVTAFTQSALGDVVSSGISGAINQTASAFTQSATGSAVLNISGVILQTVSAFTQTLSGTVAEQISGTINQTVSSFTMSAAGKIPASWIDKLPANTAWSDQAAIGTIWTDK